LQLVTFGFYRFWLTTDVRQHLWSHTSVTGDAFEYTGRGLELLLGFLLALAVLSPIYVGYFILGIELERVQSFASFPLFVLCFVLAQFAIYRARRYRLTRTIWRGVRFWMTGFGVNYAVRSSLWMLLVIITLGGAYPWRAAAIERYKMRHTRFGNLAGSFIATGGEFFRQAGWIWVVFFCPAIALVLASVATSDAVGPGTKTALVIFAVGFAALFAARQLLEASYSRDAERNADAFAIATMRRLGRSPAPMGELLLRVTGDERNRALSILATHPLTGERLETLKQATGPANGAPLLSVQEWDKLRAICGG
jgi:uncharacterized membrane protein YjgN (DUF898 family)